MFERIVPPGFEDMTTRDYRAMVTDDIKHNKQVEFPYGTLWMRVYAGVRVRPPP